MLEVVAAQVDNAWWYVAAAYTVVLGGVVGYVAALGVRIRRTRRQLDNLA